MDEIKNCQLYKFPVHNGLPQPYPFPSAVTPEITEGLWQMPPLTEASTSSSKTAAADIEHVKPSLDLLKDMQFSQIAKNGFSLEGEYSDSKLKCRTRKVFDLQLPADAYIDVEDSDMIEREHRFNPFCGIRDNSSVMCDIKCEDDVKLTLGTGVDSSKGSWNSDPIWQNAQSTQTLNFLNDSRKGVTCKGQSGSVPNHFDCINTIPKEVHAHEWSTRSSRGFLPRNFFANKYRDEGACSYLFDDDMEKSEQRWPLFNHENGKNFLTTYLTLVGYK